MPKAASAPPTNAPIVTQTGAPGPHARPAIAPPAIPPPMPAVVERSSFPAAETLFVEVAMLYAEMPKETTIRPRPAWDKRARMVLTLRFELPADLTMEA